MRFQKLSKRKLIGLTSLLIILVVRIKFGPHLYDLNVAAQKTTQDLPITIMALNSKEIINYFNQIARDDDTIGFTEHAMDNRIRYEQLIALIEKGLINHNFPSWQRAEDNVDYLKDKVDCFSYDMEKWENTPEEEWQNISYSSSQMARVTHENGLCYSGSLSYQLAKEPGNIEDMAEFTDIYGPHSHGFLKENPGGYSDFLREQAERAKVKNPDVKIEIMVATTEGTPDVDILYNIISDSLGFTDRVMIYHGADPDSVNKMKQLISLMRFSPPTFNLIRGWNEVSWPDVSGKKASDIPVECPIAVAKENFWLAPFVRDFGGVNFNFEKGKTYYLKCDQATVWNL